MDRDELLSCYRDLLLRLWVLLQFQAPMLRIRRRDHDHAIRPEINEGFIKIPYILRIKNKLY